MTDQGQTEKLDIRLLIFARDTRSSQARVYRLRRIASAWAKRTPWQLRDPDNLPIGFYRTQAAAVAWVRDRYGIIWTERNRPGYNSGIVNIDPLAFDALILAAREARKLLGDGVAAANQEPTYCALRDALKPFEKVKL